MLTNRIEKERRRRDVGSEKVDIVGGGGKYVTHPRD